MGLSRPIGRASEHTVLHMLDDTLASWLESQVVVADTLLA